MAKEPVSLLDFSGELTFLNYSVEFVLPNEIIRVPFLKEPTKALFEVIIEYCITENIG